MRFTEQLNFIGHFDRLHEDASILLHQLGLWGEYGKSGWGPKGLSAMFETNDAPHRTNAHAQIERYLSAQQVERVRQAYYHDYRMFDRLGLVF